jgi:hypothetical protein
MYTTINKNRLSSLITRTAAVMFVAASATLVLHAQQSAGTNSALPPVSLKKTLAAPLDLTVPDDLNYSSSVGESEMAAAESFNLSGSEDMQPPPRRRYGRHPTYSDSTHNADGSNKYTFVVGGGFTLPVGGTHSYLTTSYAFQGGVGRNFNKNFGVIAQFDWANFGVQTHTLNDLLAIYNSLGAGLTQLNGSSHIWSFSLNPIYHFAEGEKTGAYVVGGTGFYHKTANFSIPSVGLVCDVFGNCFAVQANQSIDKYTSNAFGLNAGLGATYKFSRFADERFFVEVRYVYTFNSRRAETGTTPANTPPGSTAFNAFPQNSDPTSFIPVIFGIRF